MKKPHILFNRFLHIVFCITLISVMEVSCIAPVLPKISDALSITAAQANLLLAVFTMPGIFLSPFFGIAADRFGRKKVLVPALLLFGICGTAAGFSENFSLILVLRFFQGTGAASLGSLNQTIIGDIFHGDQRVAAMGYNSSVVSVGTMLYPSIGGAVAMLGWHYPFFLAALAFPVSLIVVLGLNYSEPATDGKLGQYLKKSFRFIKNKNIISLYIGTLAAFILLYGILLAFFPFHIRKHFHSTPLVIGLAMSASSIGAIIGSFNLVRLIRRYSSKKIMVSSFLIYPAALTAAYFMPAIWLFIIPVFVYGFANGILIPNIQTQIAILAPEGYRGAFMSINSSVLRLGQTVGPLFTGMIFSSFSEGYVFAAGAAFAVITAIFLSYGINDKKKPFRK